MAMLHYLFTFILPLILCFFSTAAVAKKGTATFYSAPYTPSACYGNKDEGVMIAAASKALWKGGAACGTRYKIKCVGGTNEAPHPCKKNKAVTVTIVDYCPPGQCHATIDLSQEAFEKIASPDAGKVKIDFRHV